MSMGGMVAPSLLVVARGDEPLGPAVVAALRQYGWAAQLATTPEGARTAASFRATIVIIAPGQGDDPVVAAALRTFPARLIPLLTEAGSVPPAAWASAPILATGDVATTARAVLAAAFGPVPPPLLPPLALPFVSAPPSMPVAPLTASPTPAAVTPSLPAMEPVATQRVNRIPIVLGIIGIVLVVTLIVGSVVVVVTHIPSATAPYAAAAPGPACDNGGAHWDTSADATFTCGPDGTTLTSQDTENIQGLYFSPPAQSIPLSYRVTVEGTFVQASTEGALVIGVHRGEAGAQNFIVQSNRLWTLAKLDSFENAYSYPRTGFLAASVDATHLTLSVEVDGAVLHCSIDGQEVATFTDGSLLSTDDILIGGYDQSAFTLRFSHFTYMPLPNPTGSLDGALATATAQTISRNATPYHAHVPGYGCDNGGAAWSPITVGNKDGVALTCTPNGMEISRTTKDTYLGTEYFYWFDTFPRNYMVSARITFPTGANVCGAFLTRFAGLRNYFFEVCRTGHWEVDKYAEDGTSTRLASGSVTPAASSTLTATVREANQVLAIDGKTLSTTQDADLTTTAYLGLALDPTNSGGVGAVVFSDFTLTPLP